MGTILYGRDAPSRLMYDPTGVSSQVPLNRVVKASELGWTHDLPTIAVTGTAIAGGVAEAAIVTGGETLIFTLNGGTWSADVLAELDTLTAAVFLNGSVAAGTGWDAQVGDAMSLLTDAVRTSDVVVTVTTPAAASYAISGDETVTFSVPQSLIQVNGVQWTGSTALVCSPTTFVITNA